MLKTVAFDVKGLHCPNCPAKIEKAVYKMEGVQNIQINYQSEDGSMTFNEEITDLSHVITRIQKMGFEVVHVTSR